MKMKFLIAFLIVLNLAVLLVAGPSIFSVYQGGTGAGSFTAHGVLLGEGSSAFNVAVPSTSGYVLTSNGSSIDPTFQAAASSAPTYSLSSYGAVADDSTDNATAVGNFTTAVNTYAGNGVVHAVCVMPTGGKAFKTSVGFAFTHPVLFDGGCTIDYSGSGAAVTLGPTGASSFPTNQQAYTAADLTFIGGSSMSAGILLPAYLTTAWIHDNNFLNFGNSSAYAIDANGGPVNEIHAYNNRFWVNDSTTGRNGFRFYDSSGLGSVSAFISNNSISSAEAPSSFNSPCGGVGLYIGSAHSKVIGNSFFGFSPNLRISNQSNTAGLVIDDNAFDSGGCTNSSLNSNIQLGDASHSGEIDTVNITNNEVCRGTLFDATPSVTSVSLVNSVIGFNHQDHGAAYSGSGGCTGAVTAFTGVHTGTCDIGNTNFTGTYPNWCVSNPQIQGFPLGILAQDAFGAYSSGNAPTPPWTSVHQDGTWIKAAIQVGSSTAFAATNAGGAASYYSSMTFPSNQYAQATISTIGSNGGGVMTNIQASATTYYLFAINSTGIFIIKNLNAGGNTTEATASNSTSAGPCPTGAVMRLSNSNNGVLTAYCNGISVLTWSDSSPILGGFPGVWAFGGSSGNSVLINFSGGVD